jgi:UDP-N-acetylmuramoyl-L-alanyl-D-glutamate--2,6-diaminopimelate ligase
MSVDVERLVAALRRPDLLVEERGTLPARVAAVTDDSRLLRPGGLFVAVRGTDRDGHDYLDEVKTRGAAAAVVEDASRTTLPALVVRDGRRAAAIVAGEAFGAPADGLTLIGVTGTNGKTTTVGMLRHLLDEPGSRAASIGTLGVRVGSAGEVLEGGAGLTTPGPIELQRVLRALVEFQGVRAVAMEVSSHSLDQRRVEGVGFDAGVFTNLTQDHLDYHRTMEAYLAAKALLVAQLRPGGAAIVNADDPAWRALPRAPRLLRFGVRTAGVDARALDVRYGDRGSEWTLEMGGSRHEVRLPLIGAFNVENALGAAAAAWAVGVAPATVAQRLSTLPQVPGRLEILHEQPTVLRDYAHTPDALARALEAVRPFTRRDLILVFGCGGDRDRSKRPLMGAIAAKGADRIIVTSDNPRTEDPERILDDIEQGMGGRAHERVEDRRDAIARAIEIAGDGDVVLLAGKGHETYQIRGTTKLPFDERLIVHELMGRLS